MNSAPIIRVENLTVIYDGHTALEDVSVDIFTGERVAIIGPNGAGKSTLIKTLMGLLQPRNGTVRTPPPHKLGYVPQHEAVNWDFPVTVRDVVMMGQTRQLGWLKQPRQLHWQAVEAALARVGLVAVADRQVGELSGGQRRRVFIARALVQRAEVLIMDEPFSGVDASAQAEIMDVLDTLHVDGLTIVLCTHDLDLAFTRFDRVLALNRQCVAYGPPAEIYTTAMLTRLYSNRLMTVRDGEQVTVFMDDHHCSPAEE